MGKDKGSLYANSCRGEGEHSLQKHVAENEVVNMCREEREEGKRISDK